MMREHLLLFIGRFLILMLSKFRCRNLGFSFWCKIAEYVGAFSHVSMVCERLHVTTEKMLICFISEKYTGSFCFPGQFPYFSVIIWEGVTIWSLHT